MPLPPVRPPSWRPFAWGGAAALLALPLVAGAPWTPADYGFAAVLIGGAGGAIELGVRSSHSHSYRAGAVVAVATAFALLWVDAAVGVLGDGDNPSKALFALVLLAALGGTAFARLRADGTARAMRAAAALQLATGAIGWRAGWASPGTAGVIEAVVAGGLFGASWLVAAALFARAARQSVAHNRTASPSI